VAKLEDLELDEQTLIDTLEAIGGELETKAMNTAFVAKNLEATAAQIEAHAKAMTERAKAMKNRAERLRNYLKDGLKLAKVDKIDTPYFRIKIALNPAKLVIEDESKIPDAYKTEPEPPQPVPNNALIKTALADGFKFPAARWYAASESTFANHAMHTVILPHLSSYTEYSRVDGGSWFPASRRAAFMRLLVLT
jgi:hypothetical protein